MELQPNHEELTIDDTDSDEDGPPPKKLLQSNNRYFRDVWKHNYPWLKVDSENERSKFCAVCEVHFVGGASHIERHAKTVRHIKTMKIMKTTPKIEHFVQNITPEIQSYKILEVTLALFIADHNLSLFSLDHLEKCLKAAIPDSKIVANFSINRRKGTRILSDIVAPQNRLEISDLCKTNYYSIIIDESTDVGSVKNLAVVIRIFDKNLVKDRLLGLIELKETYCCRNV